jgi:hypothetical protein
MNLNNTPYNPQGDHKGKTQCSSPWGSLNTRPLKLASFRGLRTTSKHSWNTCNLLSCEAFIEEITCRMANKTWPSSKYQFSHAIFAWTSLMGTQSLSHHWIKMFSRCRKLMEQLQPLDIVCLWGSTFHKLPKKLKITLWMPTQISKCL